MRTGRAAPLWPRCTYTSPPRGPGGLYIYYYIYHFWPHRPGAVQPRPPWTRGPTHVGFFVLNYRGSLPRHPADPGAVSFERAHYPRHPADQGACCLTLSCHGSFPLNNPRTRVQRPMAWGRCTPLASPWTGMATLYYEVELRLLFNNAPNRLPTTKPHLRRATSIHRLGPSLVNRLIRPSARHTPVIFALRANRLLANPPTAPN